MRVITTMEIANRCKIPYSKLKYLLDKGAIGSLGVPVKPSIRIPHSGGYGFTVQQAAAIIKELTGEDLRDFK